MKDFKSENCIEKTHENCALGFMCVCGCHYPTPSTKDQLPNLSGEEV